MLLFDRKVKLIVTASDGTFKEWSELDIDFAIEKTQEVEPNKAKIIIYNFNEDSRSFVSKKSNSIIFQAGYGNSIQSIFTGNLIENGVANEYNGSTWATTLDCQDGGNKLATTKVSKSYEGSVNMSSTIDYLIDAMGLGRGVLKGIPNKSYNNGLALKGLARDRLAEICKKENLRFFVQDNNVYILPIGEQFNKSIEIINSDTGLIGSPIKTKDGLRVTCLLNYNIKVGYPVTVESKTLRKSSFKVNKLIHNGNNFGGNFFTEFEATAL